jgi:hypothetical protein
MCPELAEEIKYFKRLIQSDKGIGISYRDRFCMRPMTPRDRRLWPLRARKQTVACRRF